MNRVELEARPKLMRPIDCSSSCAKQRQRAGVRVGTGRHVERDDSVDEAG